MISPGKHMKLQTQDIFYDYDFSQKIKIKNKKNLPNGFRRD